MATGLNSTFPCCHAEMLAFTVLVVALDLSLFSVLDSIVVSIPACHAGDPGSIPGRGVFLKLGVKMSHYWARCRLVVG